MAVWAASTARAMAGPRAGGGGAWAWLAVRPAASASALSPMITIGFMNFPPDSRYDRLVREPYSADGELGKQPLGDGDVCLAEIATLEQQRGGMGLCACVGKTVAHVQACRMAAFAIP